MKRIHILYDGLQYSMGQEDYEGLKATIEEIIETGRPTWITVNQGEGSPRPAELLVGPTTAIALVAIPLEE